MTVDHPHTSATRTSMSHLRLSLPRRRRNKSPSHTCTTRAAQRRCVSLSIPLSTILRNLFFGLRSSIWKNLFWNGYERSLSGRLNDRRSNLRHHLDLRWLRRSSFCNFARAYCSFIELQGRELHCLPSRHTLAQLASEWRPRLLIVRRKCAVR